MRGFTLYEVLIVTALVGFVAAICGGLTSSLHKTDRHTAVYVKDVTDLRRAVREIETDLRRATSVRDLTYKHENESLYRGERVLARNIAVFDVSEQDGLATVRVGLGQRRDVAAARRPVVVVKVRLAR